MTIEFSKDELKELLRCMDECESDFNHLEDKIVYEIARREELESIELNDCGDSCKL